MIITVKQGKQQAFMSVIIINAVNKEETETVVVSDCLARPYENGSKR